MTSIQLPRISIVTPCFNSEKYIEKTILSVIEQCYPNLEYIVVDGGSTDGTLDIIGRYRDKISILISENDGGQYFAIQKGLSAATGSVLGWLNSDDLYVPWTFAVIGAVFSRFESVDWLTGTPSFANSLGQCIRRSGSAVSSYPAKFVRNGWFSRAYAGYLQQESMFWRRSLWDRVGGLNLNLKLAADFDLWRRFAIHAEIVPIGIQLAMFRLLPGVQRSSVFSDEYESEVARVCNGLMAPPWPWRNLSYRSEVFRHLLRMLSWHKSTLISWDSKSQDWQLTRTRLPISRISFVDLVVELSLRRVR